MESILRPSLAETINITGSNDLNFSVECLEGRRSLELLNMLTSSRALIDDRFNAALALRSRNLISEGLSGETVVAQLFSLVEKSATGSQADGTPNYTLAEKHTGILASVALQHNAMSAPAYAGKVIQWLHDGIIAMLMQAQIDNIADCHAELGQELPERFVASPREQLQRSRAQDRAFRAAVILAGTADTEAVGRLCSALLDRRIPDEFKIFAINALVGTESPAIGGSFVALLADNRTAPSVHAHLLNVLAVYCPQDAALQRTLAAGKEILGKEALRADLALNLSDAAMLRAFEACFDACLTPRYTRDQAALAQTFIGAEAWRPLLHLKHFESRLIPDDQDGVLHELLPDGARGDLITAERIRSR